MMKNNNSFIIYVDLKKEMFVNIYMQLIFTYIVLVNYYVLKVKSMADRTKQNWSSS